MRLLLTQLLIAAAFISRQATAASCADCLATPGQSWCEYRQRCMSTSAIAAQRCWSGPATNQSDAWRATSCPVEFAFATCASTTYVQLPNDRPGFITLSPPGVPYLSQLNCIWLISPLPFTAFNNSALENYGGTDYILDGRGLGRGDVLALYDIQLSGSIRYERPDYGAAPPFFVQGPSSLIQAIVRHVIA